MRVPSGLTWEDLPYCAAVVGIYLLLALLSLWGALAWDSLFMLIFSGIWFYMALTLTAWFIFMPAVEGDDREDGS